MPLRAPIDQKKTKAKWLKSRNHQIKYSIASHGKFKFNFNHIASHGKSNSINSNYLLSLTKLLKNSQKFSNTLNFGKFLAESPLYGGTSAISQDRQKCIHRLNRPENKKRNPKITIHISYFYFGVGVPYFSVYKRVRLIFYAIYASKTKPYSLLVPVLTQFKSVSDITCKFNSIHLSN